MNRQQIVSGIASGSIKVKRTEPTTYLFWGNRFRCAVLSNGSYLMVRVGK